MYFKRKKEENCENNKKLVIKKKKTTGLRYFLLLLLFCIFANRAVKSIWLETVLQDKSVIIQLRLLLSLLFPASSSTLLSLEPFHRN